MPGDPANTDVGEGREARIGRLLDDFLGRRARGEAVDEAALLAAHPDLADDLRSHLDLLGGLRPSVNRLEQLITQGILARSDDSRYPAELGPYKVLDFLGRGGMGIVLMAYEESLNRTVALKILRPDFADDEPSLARFEREAKAAASLRHPNIVTVYAVGRERGASYIAMEYVAGPSLTAVVRTRGPLPTESVRAIFRQLLSALDAAHSAGLIHRDVKSANILLDHGWEVAADTAAPSQSAILDPQAAIVKLADFGLARMQESQTQLTLTQSVLGTPEYMSPEQARGDRDIDHRADLYSAGVVLYEMLTGQTPFHSDAPTATIQRILHEPPAHPKMLVKDADPTLASLALRLMEKRKEDRLSGAAEAIALLDRGASIPLMASRRRRRRAAALAGLVLALLAAGAWYGSNPPATSSRPDELQDLAVSDTLPRIITVRHRGETDFREFGFQSPAVACAELVRDDETGRQIVAVGLLRTEGGANLLGLDIEGHELWRTRLGDALGRPWPDCGEAIGGGVFTDWACCALASGNLDGRPGDELVAATSDTHDYPTRISIVDPRTGELRPGATFWHLGDVMQVLIMPDFFGPGQGAIVGRGCGNKLDGFDDTLLEGEIQYAEWDVVSVLFVLDPARMNGIGPPATRRFPEFDEARPYSYAFLNLPVNRDIRSVPRGAAPLKARTPEQLNLPLEEVAQFQVVCVREREPAVGEPRNDRSFFLEVPVKGRQLGDATIGLATFFFDAELRLLAAKPVNMGGAQEHDLKHWERKWHPIIQGRRYTAPAAEGLP